MGYIMSLLSSFKTNIGAIMFGSAGSVIAIVGALFTIDARYAHAADVQKTNNETQKQIIESTNTLRRQMLEDKLFELGLKKAQDKKPLSAIDQALSDRYKQQLNDLNRK